MKKVIVTKETIDPTRGFKSDFYQLPNGMIARAVVEETRESIVERKIYVKLYREEFAPNDLENVKDKVNCSYIVEDKPELTRYELDRHGNIIEESGVVIQEATTDFTDYVKMKISDINDNDLYNELQDIYSVNTRDRALVEAGLKDLPLLEA